ncbi:ABC transporter permease [Thalassomonas haliotis]|uniref:ABC transporter permease n=1 Tax=Thalassomonas haliotis TaxID=485448 RepID=A0ABY7VG31_9GAMM|nr:ABC transporter permease [Thalassomonas haliotis]WDE12659.1 ABC transporter permease [Thalassomonas haliotis]
MLDFLYFESKMFFNYLKSKPISTSLSCLLLAFCLSLTYSFYLAIDAIEHSNQPNSGNNKAYTVVVEHGADINATKVNSFFVQQLKALKLEKLAAIGAFNNGVVDFTRGSYQQELNVEVIEFELLNYIDEINLQYTQDELIKMEAMKEQTLFISDNLVNQLKSENIIIGKGSLMNLNGAVYSVAGIIPKAFRGFSGKENVVDIWLPQSSVAFVKKVPKGLYPDGNYLFSDTLLIAFSRNDFDGLLHELHWLEQVLYSSGSLKAGEQLKLLSGIQSNYTKFVKQKELLTVNMMATAILLALGVFSFSRFRITQLLQDGDNTKIRLAAGNTVVRHLYTLILQNLFLIGVVIVVSVGLYAFLSRYLYDLLGINLNDVEIYLYHFLIAIGVGLFVISMGQFLILKGYSNSQLAQSLKSRNHPINTVLNSALSAVSLLAVVISIGLIGEYINYQQTPYGYQAADRSVLQLEIPKTTNGLLYSSRDFSLVNVQIENLAQENNLLIAMSDKTFFSGINDYTGLFYLPMENNGYAELNLQSQYVTSNFFTVSGISFSDGRAFTNDERDVVVVNQKFADVYFHGESPVNQSLYQDFYDMEFGENSASVLKRNRTARHIVGVVDNFYPGSKGIAIKPEIYLPLTSEIQIRSLIVHHQNSPSVDFSDIYSQMSLSNVVKDIYSLEEKQKIDSQHERAKIVLFLLSTLLSLFTLAFSLYTEVHQWCEFKKNEIYTRFSLGSTKGKLQQLIFFRMAKISLIGGGSLAFAVILSHQYFSWFKVAEFSCANLLLSLVIFSVLTWGAVIFASMNYNSISKVITKMH